MTNLNIPSALNQKIDELISLVIPTNLQDHKLYKELLLTTIRMAQSDRSYWEVKIAQNALKEMENGFALLDRFKHRRKITIFGSARTPITDPLYQQAKQLGKLLADHHFMVITGAGGGIMAAAHEGAGAENALGFNIELPFEQHANETMEGTDVLLTFHFFFTRKLFFVKEAEGIVLCPGGFGTWDEALEVLTLIQTGKTPLVPVILLETPESNYWKKAIEYFNTQLKDNHYILPEDMRFMRLAHNPEEAYQEIAHFYSNYQSSRWFKNNTFAIRMKHLLTPTALEQLNNNFADICTTGDFTQQPYDDSLQEPKFKTLNYLLFHFDGKHQGRLRQLIDEINLSKHWLTQ